MFVKYYINVKFYHTSTNHISFHGLHLLNYQFIKPFDKSSWKYTDFICFIWMNKGLNKKRFKRCVKPLGNKLDGYGTLPLIWVNLIRFLFSFFRNTRDSIYILNLKCRCRAFSDTSMHGGKFNHVHVWRQCAWRWTYGRRLEVGWV